MRPSEREVAGLTCSAVMAALSDFVDGELAQDLRAPIEAHVAACDWCERFGAGFVQMLTAMRRHMATPDPVPAAVLDRLRGAIDRP